MATLTERAKAFREAAKAVRVGTLTLAQFAGSGRRVVINSSILECELVLAADNAHVPDTETRPVYRARELAAVWDGGRGLSADGLRLLHEVKTRFGGEVEADPMSTT